MKNYEIEYILRFVPKKESLATTVVRSITEQVKTPEQDIQNAQYVAVARKPSRRFQLEQVGEVVEVSGRTVALQPIVDYVYTETLFRQPRRPTNPNVTIHVVHHMDRADFRFQHPETGEVASMKLIRDYPPNGAHIIDDVSIYCFDRLLSKFLAQALAVVPQISGLDDLKGLTKWIHNTFAPSVLPEESKISPLLGKNLNDKTAVCRHLAAFQRAVLILHGIKATTVATEVNGQGHAFLRSEVARGSGSVVTVDSMWNLCDSAYQVHQELISRGLETRFHQLSNAEYINPQPDWYIT